MSDHTLRHTNLRFSSNLPSKNSLWSAYFWTVHRSSHTQWLVINLSAPSWPCQCLESINNLSGSLCWCLVLLMMLDGSKHTGFRETVKWILEMNQIEINTLVGGYECGGNISYSLWWINTPTDVVETISKWVTISGEMSQNSWCLLNESLWI